MSYGLLLAGALGYFIGSTLVGTFWFIRHRMNKKKSTTGTSLLVGLRPTTNQARIKPLKTIRGTYRWTEKDFEADIPLDNAFQMDLGDGHTLAMVDLDAEHAITYRGSCLNDLGSVAIQRNGSTVDPMKESWGGPDVEVKLKNGSTKIVKNVWMRMPGSRIAKVRQDLRVQQMQMVVTSWWMIAGRFVPLIAICGTLLSLATLVVVAKMSMG